MQSEGNVEGKINVWVTREIEIIWITGCEWQLTKVTYKFVGCSCRTKVMLKVDVTWAILLVIL